MPRSPGAWWRSPERRSRSTSPQSASPRASWWPGRSRHDASSPHRNEKPPLLTDLLLFAIGLAGLFFGAEWFIGGAARLAAALGVSSLVLGLTLVSLGTSAPELVVSGLAAYRGNGELAIGNVLGSNVANVALILGVAALILPIAVERDLVARDVPVMILSALLVPLLGMGGAITRSDGLVLLLGFCLYLALIARAARRESASVISLVEELGPPKRTTRELTRDGVVAVAGLIVLSVGARVLVGSAVSLATELGVPELVVGLTLVAFGTSLPELATSISAARRGDGQIVIGNIVGSNIFNILLILGASATINPLPVSRTVLRVDAPIVVVLSLALLPLVLTRHAIGRLEGGALVASYLAFIVWTAT